MKKIFLAFLCVLSACQTHRVEATDVGITIVNCTGRKFGQWNNNNEYNTAWAHVVGHDSYGIVGGDYSLPVTATTFGNIGGAPNTQVTGEIWCQRSDSGQETSVIFTFPSNAGETDHYTYTWFVYHSSSSCPQTGLNHTNDPGCDGDCPIGMPVWQVSEPYISLWLKDEPLGYQPPLGPRVSFQLSYNQREASAGSSTNIFSTGRKWNFPWFSFVNRDANGSNVVHFPGGGARTIGDGADYLTDTRLTGDTNAGFTLTYPDGSSDAFGFVVTNASGAFQMAFLTAQANPAGQGLRLEYAGYDPASPVVRLQRVIDANGGTNSITYVSSNGYSTNLISQVTDAFGRTASMAYDNNGQLTNITDVAGISSSFTYDYRFWPLTMVTPYGATSFAITDASTNDVVLNSRTILITEPDGSHQLYRYTDKAPAIPGTYASGNVPATSPYGNTFDNSGLDDHNTFHWGRKQFAALATTNIWSFGTNEYAKARMRHWLMADPNTLGSTLSLERAPSQDGTTAGQVTWYDYAGKTNASYEGAQSLPLFVAQVLPNGSTHFVRNDRNANGFTTNEVSTYSTASGSVALRTNTYTFAANNTDLIAATNALGIQVSSNSYNAFHQVLTNFNVLNEQKIYTYNATQQLTSVTLPSGLVLSTTYGADGYPSKQAAVGFATNSFTWANGLMQTQTDPRGLTLVNTWDNLQRLRRADYPDGTFVTNVYDKLDLVRVTDRMGFNDSFGYNSLRQLIAATNANNVVTRYSYCTCGSLESVTNAFGANEQAVTSYSWDLQENLLSTTEPDGYFLTFKYNSLGQRTNVSDAIGSVTNWFDNQGLLIASSNAAGRLGSVVYDVLDRSITNIDANAVVVASTFENLNRLSSRTYPDGGIEHFGYSPGISAHTRYTNQLSFPTLLGYDALGRKTAETNANNEVIQFGYSPGGDLVTLTDGKNQTTTWHYDEYGRATNKVDALGNIIFKFNYDQNNRLTNRWTPAKGTTIYGFDNVGSLTSVQYPVSSNITLAYDLLKRLTNMVDAVGTSKYTYDGAGQILSEDGPWDSDTVSYTYSARLRSSLNLFQPGASAWTNGYGYDAAKRLTDVTSQAGTFGYTYPAASSQYQVSRLSLPNGSFITNNYDSSARLLSTVLKNSGQSTLDSHSYQLNQGNQRTRQTFTAGNYVDYTYDSVGQLKTAIGKEGGGSTLRLNEQFGYAYDTAANLNFRTNNDLMETFSVNSRNELSTISRGTSMTVAGVTSMAATNVALNGLSAAIYGDRTFARTNVGLSDGNNTFTAVAQDAYGRCDTNSSICYLPSSISCVYDANGNLRTNGSRIFDYDDENELTRITEPSAWKSEFTYDGKLRRRIGKEFSWVSGSWIQTNETHYTYDNSLVIQERDGSNSVQVTYTRGVDLSGTFDGVGGIGGLLARSSPLTPAFTPAFYYSDGSGNVSSLTTTNQLVAARYAYDPYGGVMSLTGPLAEVNPYRFSSREEHASSGLVNYPARYYSTAMQRWLNRDPAQERGGLNLFAFTFNSPPNAIDDSGQGVVYIQNANGTAHVEITPQQQQQHQSAGQQMLSLVLPNPKQTVQQADEAFHQAADSSQATSMRVSAAIAGTCIIILGVVECVPGAGAETKPLKQKCIGTARDNLLNAAENARLRDAINNLYRKGARVGDGSSMDAWRYERTTGILLSKKGHCEKLINRRSQLQDLLRDPSISTRDKDVIKQILSDIQKSLSGS